MPKSVALVTVGTRGDVQPFVILSKHLLAHTDIEPIIVTTDNYMEWIESHGISYKPLYSTPKNVDDEMSRPEMADAVAKGNTSKFLELITEPLELENQKLANIIEICKDVDAMVTNQITMLHCMFAAKVLNKPCGLWLTYPNHRTNEFPFPLLPLPNFKLWNGLTFSLFDKVVWPMTARLLNDWSDKYNISVPLTSWEQRQWFESLPCFYPIDPMVLPKPASWPGQVTIGGYVLENDKSEMSQGLSNFIKKDSSQVIYIGFGSMPITKSADFGKFINELDLELQRCELKWRVVLFVGKSTPTSEKGVKLANLPEYIYPIVQCSHYVLFPLVDFIVHHGGCGTTAAALVSGTPSMVVSCFGDQPFWGSKTYQLFDGLAPKSQTYQKLSIKKLVAGIQQGLEPKVKAKAQQISTKISKDQGVEAAAKFVQSLIPDIVLR